MAEFLALPRSERHEFLSAAADALRRPVGVLEKDIWVCWALETLFGLALPMVFKGGTSLSKIYRAISRFSEDLDLTIDHAASGDAVEDPLAASVSNTKRREFSERMKRFTQRTVLETIQPHLERAAGRVPPVRISSNSDGDTLNLEFESVLGDAGYVLPFIKLEFGSRNATEPSEIRTVRPDVLAWEPAAQFAFPAAHVPVLLAERTYWEKVTLIHAELTRRNPKTNLERYSRHWYDLAQLASGEIGARALRRTDLRDHVIRTKTALFGVAGVEYDRVARGACQLVPTGDLGNALERDFAAMNEAGLFDGDPPRWAEVLETLSALEAAINR